MHVWSKGYRWLLVLLTLAGFSLSVAAQESATSQIKAEIARLQQSIQDHPFADKDLAQLVASVEETLQAASAALDSGKTYLALEDLGRAQDLLQGARVAADKAAVEKDGLPAFQAKWNKVSLHLAALDKAASSRQWNAPLAVQSLAEAAQGRALPLLEGGQGFAVATGPKEGLFYVGQAEGEADFAAFCATLTFAQEKSLFPLRSWLPELTTLQGKANAAFQPPKSIELHSRFIALNSYIKLAQELDASKLYAGALYAYLEAVRHYGMLDAPPLDEAAQAKLKQAIAAEREKLATSSADDSLAQLFLQRAESYIGHSDGSASSADYWRGASVVVNQVLPAYFAAKKPAVPMQTATGKTVEITLVRWPYT